MKRIVICADGTWNEPEKVDKDTGRVQPTNVLKMVRAVNPRDSTGVEQVVYYHSGVGTGGPLDSLTGGAFGHGLAVNVRSLYRFIVYNYAEGDELYFFGFSRGAFTVRTLCGFIHRVGLLEKDDEYYTPEIYKLYETGVEPTSEAWANAHRNINSVRPCPIIKFVGVWDTVGSLGAPGFIGQLFNKKKYQYHDVSLNDSIKNAFHALAIDEKRKPFLPTLYLRPQGWSGTLEQVWFPGAHANVGGSYSPDGLANEALQWIASKASEKDLELDHNYLAHYRPFFDSLLVDTYTIKYKAMGAGIREIGGDDAFVHQAALDRMQYKPCDYGPDNLKSALQNTSVGQTTTQNIQRGVPYGK